MEIHFSYGRTATSFYRSHIIIIQFDAQIDIRLFQYIIVIISLRARSPLADHFNAMQTMALFDGNYESDWVEWWNWKHVIVESIDFVSM